MLSQRTRSTLLHSLSTTTALHRFKQYQLRQNTIDLNKIMAQEAAKYNIDLKQALQLSIDLAYQAGKQGLEFTEAMNQGKLTIEIKQDESPVTVADKTLNEFIVSRLAKTFPTARVIGEESIKKESKDLGLGPVFFVDPIDGTKEFIKNNGEWAVMIGLIIDSRPVMGVVYRPTTDDMYYASSGEGCYKIAQKQSPIKLNANKPASLSQCTFLMSRSHNHPCVTKMLSDCQGKSVTTGSFGIKCGFIAEGLGDVYVNPSKMSHFWDSCMNEIILTEAGALLLTEKGMPISYSGLNTRIQDVIIAFPKSLSEEVVMGALHKAIKE